MGEATKRLAQVLDDVYVSDVIKDQVLLTLSAEDSVAAAAKLLIDNNISSAPVFPSADERKAEACLEW